MIFFQEYKLALLQCYERYLQQFVSVNLDDVMGDVQRFKSAFFPNGVRDKNAALMVGCGFLKMFLVKDIHRFKVSSPFCLPQMCFILIIY